MIEEKDEIFSMKLHEVLHTDWYEIIRVPGGWIYTRMVQDEGDVSSCFVPYSTQ